MPDTGWVSPGTVAQDDSGEQWSNLQNLLASDGNFASVSLPSYEYAANLLLSDFDFEIPRNSRVTKIEVRCIHRASNTNSIYNSGTAKFISPRPAGVQALQWWWTGDLFDSRACFWEPWIDSGPWPTTAATDTDEWVADTVPVQVDMVRANPWILDGMALIFPGPYSNSGSTRTAFIDAIQVRITYTSNASLPHLKCEYAEEWSLTSGDPDYNWYSGYPYLGGSGTISLNEMDVDASVGDVYVVACETNATDTVSTPTGWTKSHEEVGSTSGSRLTVFTAAYDPDTPLGDISFTGDHIHVVQQLWTNVDPLDWFGNDDSGVTASNSASPNFVSTRANTALVFCSSMPDNVNNSPSPVSGDIFTDGTWQSVTNTQTTVGDDGGVYVGVGYLLGSGDDPGEFQWGSGSDHPWAAIEILGPDPDNAYIFPSPVVGTVTQPHPSPKWARPVSSAVAGAAAVPEHLPLGKWTDWMTAGRVYQWEGTGFYEEWSNISNLTSRDGTYATVTCSSGTEDPAGLGFVDFPVLDNVPLASDIKAIEVRVRGYRSGGTGGFTVYLPISDFCATDFFNTNSNDTGVDYGEEFGLWNLCSQTSPTDEILTPDGGLPIFTEGNGFDSWNYYQGIYARRDIVTPDLFVPSDGVSGFTSSPKTGFRIHLGPDRTDTSSTITFYIDCLEIRLLYREAQHETQTKLFGPWRVPQASTNGWSSSGGVTLTPETRRLIDGDFLLLTILSKYNDTGTPSPPSTGGWTLIDNEYQGPSGNSSSIKITTYWTTWDSGSPPSFVVPQASTTLTRADLSVYRNVDATEPVMSFSSGGNTDTDQPSFADAYHVAMTGNVDGPEPVSWNVLLAATGDANSSNYWAHFSGEFVNEYTPYLDVPWEERDPSNGRDPTTWGVHRTGRFSAGSGGNQFESTLWQFDGYQLRPGDPGTAYFTIAASEYMAYTGIALRSARTEDYKPLPDSVEGGVAIPIPVVAASSCTVTPPAVIGFVEFGEGTPSLVGSAFRRYTVESLLDAGLVSGSRVETWPDSGLQRSTGLTATGNGVYLRRGGHEQVSNPEQSNYTFPWNGGVLKGAAGINEDAHFVRMNGGTTLGSGSQAIHYAYNPYGLGGNERHTNNALVETFPSAITQPVTYMFWGAVRGSQGESGVTYLDGVSANDRHVVGNVSTASDLNIFAGTTHQVDDDNDPWGNYTGNIPTKGDYIVPVAGVWRYTFDGTSSQVWFRGEQVGTTGDAGTGSAGGITIGNRYDITRDAHMWISEFLVFDRALTSDEITEIEEYLKDKWAPTQGGVGGQASIPSHTVFIPAGTSTAPDAVAATGLVPAPSVEAVTDATVTPASVAGTCSIPSTEITIDTTVVPVAVMAVATVPTVTVVVMVRLVPNGNVNVSGWSPVGAGTVWQSVAADDGSYAEFG